jgi:dienelactone hydrolase
MSRQDEVSVLSGDVTLAGFLRVPERATGVVLFAHGSGSSRFSSRNQYVAKYFNEAGLATLLFDLLTAEEHRIDDVTRELRFDIDLLGTRLIGAVDWVAAQRDTEGLRVGLFGASTGAAAALIAAAARAERVAAVVSRGGRPDLAKQALPCVRAPTLLIVGGLDGPVIDMNRSAAAKMSAPHRVRIVAGATHLFEESGKLEEVARLARDWFVTHLAERPSAEPALGEL